MSITYVEKGRGLHEAISKAGHWLREVDGVWESSNDVLVQSIIDSYEPLPEIQASMWAKIKEERDRRQSLGVKVGANHFHSDIDSRIKQLALVLFGANIPANLQWKTMEGNFVTMSQSLALSIFSLTALSDQKIFAAAEIHKANMLASLEPEKYNYLINWPED